MDFYVNIWFKSRLLHLYVPSLLAKKRKQYTSVFGVFQPLKAKIRAPKPPIDRSKARFHCNLPVFRPKRKKRTSFALGARFVKEFFIP